MVELITVVGMLLAKFLQEVLIAAQFAVRATVVFQSSQGGMDLSGKISLAVHHC